MRRRGLTGDLTAPAGELIELTGNLTAMPPRLRRPLSTGVPDSTPLPRLLTIEQIADHLGVTVRHVRRLVQERRIPFVKWGHLLRFDPAKVSVWLTQQEVQPLSVHTTSRRRARRA